MKYTLRRCIFAFKHTWEQRKLGDMWRTYTGLSGKTRDDFGHGQTRFVTYMNVFSNPICNSEMTEPIEIDSKQNEVKNNYRKKYKLLTSTSLYVITHKEKF